MRTRILWLSSVLVVAFGLLAGGGQPAVAEKLGARLTDREFWRLASEFSESDGTFHSENLVSNEARFQALIPQLISTVTPGRAYIGVGSEQNFTYIVATRPAIAFIVDIRRGNLDLHLLYKAFFELSADRADFVSKLFARPRPAGLSTSSSAAEIFAAYATAPPNRALFTEHLSAALNRLEKTHRFTLSAGDREGIEFVYSAWFDRGPDIRYELTSRGGGRSGGRGGRGPGGTPTYADLMTATDDTGQPRSYLATEANFRLVKDLQTRNLVVPVVGNFGGPKALRAVAAYLKQKEQIVSTFYTSNVEQYLRQDGIWQDFCANAAAMPMDRTSTFIRSERGGFQGARNRGGGFSLMLAPMQEHLAACRGELPEILLRAARHAEEDGTVGDALLQHR